MAIRIVIAISSLYLSQDKTKKLCKKKNGGTNPHDIFKKLILSEYKNRKNDV
jgi:hypothetical protein